MRINKKLNLVIPIGRQNDGDDSSEDQADGLLAAVVHTTPITADVFDTYFLPLSRTYAAIYAMGLGAVAGPQVADKLLKKISIEMKMWDGESGVQRGLIGEIHRRTNVAAPGENGWEQYMYDEAKKNGVLDPEYAAEVDAAIVFFTVCSVMMRKQQIKDELAGGMKLWGARLEYSDFSELLTSLQTSTVTASSGGTRTA